MRLRPQDLQRMGEPLKRRIYSERLNTKKLCFGSGLYVGFRIGHACVRGRQHGQKSITSHSTRKSEAKCKATALGDTFPVSFQNLIFWITWRGAPGGAY